MILKLEIIKKLELDILWLGKTKILSGSFKLVNLPWSSFLLMLFLFMSNRCFIFFVLLLLALLFSSSHFVELHLAYFVWEVDKMSENYTWAMPSLWYCCCHRYFDKSEALYCIITRQRELVKRHGLGDVSGKVYTPQHLLNLFLETLKEASVKVPWLSKKVNFLFKSYCNTAHMASFTGSHVLMNVWVLHLNHSYMPLFIQNSNWFVASVSFQKFFLSEFTFQCRARSRPLRWLSLLKCNCGNSNLTLIFKLKWSLCRCSKC